MSTTTDDARDALEALDVLLTIMLPEEYQQTYEDLEPRPMRSAGLKFDRDGRVAWHEIWGSFCDLAMAGGPPHKGMLLEPAPRATIDADPDAHHRVVHEICRGITMAAKLDARPSPDPGWVRVTCHSDGMAGWLLRAIVMENVAARADGVMLDLPAGPHFRLEKEIKNVVTVVAKTSHYWLGHMPASQQRAIADLFVSLARTAPLIEPACSPAGVRSADDERAAVDLAGLLHPMTGLLPSPHRYVGWLGLQCATVRAAVWMMRAILMRNVLARREGTVLFVPVNPATDPGGRLVARSVAFVHELARVRQP
jgi:hypothetical protein